MDYVPYIPRNERFFSKRGQFKFWMYFVAAMLISCFLPMWLVPDWLYIIQIAVFATYSFILELSCHRFGQKDMYNYLKKHGQIKYVKPE